MRCVIGVDLGTSGCKVVAVGADGNVLASRTEIYPLEQPKPGWTQQDPLLWWSAAAEALRFVTAAVKGMAISGVSFSGQMHGMTALDGAGLPVRPAILWNDQRTFSQCAEIEHLAGGLEALLSYTNNRMLTGYTGGKILWMKEEEPENYARTRVILTPKDYIRYRLTGLLMTEVSDASGYGLFDTKKRVWAWELIDKIGLDRSFFPPVTESAAQTGSVTNEASLETGLPEGTPVYGGGGDAVLSTTALGLLAPGRAALTLGTSGVVAMALDGYRDNAGGLVQAFCNNLPGVWHMMGVTLAAAGSYQWFRNTFAEAEIAAEEAGGASAYLVLDTLAAGAPAGSEGLVYLPYLTGERCPVQDPLAAGAFVGFTSRHTRSHFARAVLEGVAFSLKQVYDLMASVSGLPAQEFLASGGGAKSPLWLQILSDVFQAPISTVPGAEDGGAYGAALLAGIGSGVWTAQEAMALPIAVPKAHPIPENAEVYRKAYAKYVSLYPALAPFYHA